MIEVFEAIQAAFPNLVMTMDARHEEVDVKVEIRKQPGLAFDVNLNQSN
jgi:hypothetical protein